MQINNEITNLLLASLEKHGWIDLPAQGYSMFPLIRQGDICRFTLPDVSRLKRGDIILFQTVAGHLIGHRLHYVTMIDSERYYLCKGDTNIGFDERICESQLIGKLDLIRRSNKKFIPTNGLFTRMWGKMILVMPSISHLLNMYIARKMVEQSRSCFGVFL